MARNHQTTDKSSTTFNGLPKAKVYLAGPISGCNHTQLHEWRNKLKRGFCEEFEFIDPADNLIDDLSNFEAVVQADIDAIKTSDAVLANMWRESIGTAFGIIHAYDSAKVIVVADPNSIQSRMISFYADDVVPTLEGGLNAIRIHLSAKRRLCNVMKKDQTEEPFEIKKILASLHRACLSADQSTIAPPKAILKKTLDILLQASQDEELTVNSSQISDAILTALASLKKKYLSEADYKAIYEAWQSHRKGIQNIKLHYNHIPKQIEIYPHPQNIDLRTSGTHGTIWGPINEVTGDAADLFNQIKRVGGITEILLSHFTNGAKPTGRVGVTLSKDVSREIIHGVCYDNGPRGTQQTFRLRIAHSPDYDLIFNTLSNHLNSRRYLRH